MSRRAGQLPELKRHKKTGHGFVYLDGRQHFLGPFDHPDTRIKFDRLIAQWLAKGRPKSGTPTARESPTVAMIAAAFLVHADAYYRSSAGVPTGEASNFRDSLRPVLKMYRSLPAADFDQERLEAVRAAMVASGLARTTINTRVNRIRRVWRWAASKKMVPAAVHGELMTLSPLLRNRTEAKEPTGVEPVDAAAVEATLPHMPGPVAAMVRVQMLTGCRVGEVVRMRGDELDRSVEPWEYTPGQHKGQHKGRRRMIPIGPRCREVIAPFLARCGGWLFRPVDAAEESAGEGGLGRKARARLKPRYECGVYAQAIVRACDRAFPHPTISQIRVSRSVKLTDEQKAELKAWRKAHRWSPLQIRHTVGTAVRRRLGVEAAQAVLGHAKADVTQVYAERLDGVAKDFATEAG